MSSAYLRIWWAARGRQRDADAQASQQCDVQQQIREVVVFDDCAVQCDDEHPVAEPGHVTQDFAEVREAFVHFGRGPWSFAFGHSSRLVGSPMVSECTAYQDKAKCVARIVGRSGATMVRTGTVLRTTDQGQMTKDYYAMPENVVIIGSGPAAWTAAIYAARANLNPLVFEGNPDDDQNRINGTMPLGQLARRPEVENLPRRWPFGRCPAVPQNGRSGKTISRTG